MGAQEIILMKIGIYFLTSSLSEVSYVLCLLLLSKTQNLSFWLIYISFGRCVESLRFRQLPLSWLPGTFFTVCFIGHDYETSDVTEFSLIVITLTDSQ